MMPSKNTVRHAFPDPNLQILAVERISDTPHYCAIVYQSTVKRQAPVRTVLVVDMDAERYAVSGKLASWQAGAPLQSHTLIANERLQLVGVVDALPDAAELSIVGTITYGRIEGAQLQGTFPIANGVVVADLGPADATLNLSQLTITDADHAIVWQTIGHPALDVPLPDPSGAALAWFDTDPARSMVRFCRQARAR